MSQGTLVLKKSNLSNHIKWKASLPLCECSKLSYFMHHSSESHIANSKIVKVLGKGNISFSIRYGKKIASQLEVQK